MPKQVIPVQDHTNPASYSHVVKAGNTVYLAGQTPVDAGGNVVGRGDIAAQVEQVYRNIEKCLAAAGATFNDIVKTQTFVTDPRFLPVVSQVRQMYLKAPFPTSTFLVVATLASPDYLVEIDVIAVVA